MAPGPNAGELVEVKPQAQNTVRTLAAVGRPRGLLGRWEEPLEVGVLLGRVLLVVKVLKT